jgi:hypothetical protein
MKRIKVTERVKQLEGAMAMMEEQKMMLDNALQMKDVMNAIKLNSLAVKEASKGGRKERRNNRKKTRREKRRR